MPWSCTALVSWDRLRHRDGTCDTSLPPSVRGGGRGSSCDEGLQLHLNQLVTCHSDQGEATTSSCITSTSTMYKTRVQRSLKKWMCSVGCSGASHSVTNCKLQPRSQPGRKSMCIRSIQKQWLSLKTPNFCFPSEEKQKDLRSYYFCLAYSCNLRGKNQPKTLFPFPIYQLRCRSVSYLYY